MRSFILLILILCSNWLCSQEITNLVFVGPNGILNDSKGATGFILVKRFADGHFERLDYKMAGPLSMRRSYKDQDLKILNGSSYEYAPSGIILESGQYTDNQKDGKWFKYDDTGRIAKILRFENGELIREDSADREKDGLTDKALKRPEFHGGLKRWLKYISKALEKSEAAEKSFHGGVVKVNFRIDTLGKPTNIFLNKSVEYILDEEAIKVIENSPPWNPALFAEEKVSYSFIQMISFEKE